VYWYSGVRHRIILPIPYLFCLQKLIYWWIYADARRNRLGVGKAAKNVGIVAHHSSNVKDDCLVKLDYFEADDEDK